MRITVVTVNYNGAEKTKNLLDSLSSQSDHDFETIVVDNGSAQNDIEDLRAGLAGAFLIANGKNLGFSGGNNIGIKKALENGSDWVLLLNNDTWAEKGVIASLKAKLSQIEPPRKGVLVGLAIEEGEKTAYAGKIWWLRPEGHHIYDKGHALKEPNKYVIGGALAIHKNVFETIGFLDEKYFLYFEDQDFSIRAKRAGISLKIFDDIKISHWPSSSTKKLGSPLLMRYHYRNAFYFNWKNGPVYIKFLVWPWSFWIMKKQILKMMLGYRSEHSYAILNAVLDFYRGKMGQINL